VVGLTVVVVALTVVVGLTVVAVVVVESVVVVVADTVLVGLTVVVVSLVVVAVVVGLVVVVVSRVVVVVVVVVVAASEVVVVVAVVVVVVVVVVSFVVSSAPTSSSLTTSSVVGLRVVCGGVCVVWVVCFAFAVTTGVLAEDAAEVVRCGTGVVVFGARLADESARRLTAPEALFLKLRDMAYEECSNLQGRRGFFLFEIFCRERMLASLGGGVGLGGWSIAYEDDKNGGNIRGKTGPNDPFSTGTARGGERGICSVLRCIKFLNFFFYPLFRSRSGVQGKEDIDRERGKGTPLSKIAEEQGAKKKKKKNTTRLCLNE
ncbi:hypothetical protein EDD21DRAFT_96463, partial [Dissophora ornata]